MSPPERCLQEGGLLRFIFLPHECVVPSVVLAGRAAGIKMQLFMLPSSYLLLEPLAESWVGGFPAWGLP